MNIFDDDDEVIADTTNFNINKEYAKRYEHNKKREQTQQLQEKYKNELNDSGSIDSESDSEVEDENGELITPQIDAQIMKTIALIRAKDNEVYDQSKTFFSESDLNHAQQLWEQKKSTQSKEKPIYLKDYHRDNLLGNNKNKDDTLTFTEQQSVVKDELKNAIQEFDATNEDSEDLFTIRKKDENEEEIENKAYQEFLLSQMYKDEPDKSKWVDIKRNGQMDEDQQFLMDFILNKGWVDKDATKLPTFEEITKHDLTDEEDEERMEQFENAYNFRYEEEGSSKVITHARNVPGVVRRENSARVIKRQTLKERKEEEKKQRQEELKRLKNLKMEELEKKLKQIQDMAGGELIGFDSSVLEADFDPDNYDQKMNEVFADEYYKDQELKKSGKPKKPVFEDDIDISDLIDEVPKASKKRKKTATAYVEELLKDVDNDANDEGAPIIDEMSEQKRDLQKYLEEYYQMDYEDIVGDLPVRFKYTKVKPKDYSLKPEEILLADDADLNEVISLKKIAPYRTGSVLEHDEDRWKKTKKKKLWEFRAKLKGSNQSTSTDVVEEQSSSDKKYQRDAKIDKSRLASYSTTTKKKNKK